MSPRAVAALAAAAVCLIPALGAQAAERSQCQRLRGVDRAPDRQVKLVKRLDHDRLANGSRGSKLVGCVLPRGRVRTIAVRKGVENDLAQEFGYTIGQVAGRIVLLDQHGTEGGYGSAKRTMVWDLGSGRFYTIAYDCFGKDISCAAEYDVARKVIVTRDGRAVAALEHYVVGGRSSTIRITSFAPDGTRRLLDEGSHADLPRASLALTGSIASWTHAGQPRNADIR